MKLLLLIVSVLTIFVGGCATSPPNSDFDSDFLPKPEYYVGGGFDINIVTPDTGGTLILVDNISKKTIMTHSTPPNNSFEFSQDPTSADFVTGLKNIGIDPENMKLSLYFIPDKPKEVIPVKPEKECTESTEKVKS